MTVIFDTFFDTFDDTFDIEMLYVAILAQGFLE